MGGRPEFMGPELQRRWAEKRMCAGWLSVMGGRLERMGGGHVYNHTSYDGTAKSEMLANLLTVGADGKNFLDRCDELGQKCYGIINAANGWGEFKDHPLAPAFYPWHDEGQWAWLMEDFRLFAKTCKVGRMRGIGFDSELYDYPYPDSGWSTSYYNMPVGQTAEQTRAWVSKRGQQFATITAEEIGPDAQMFIYGARIHGGFGEHDQVLAGNTTDPNTFLSQVYDSFIAGISQVLPIHLIQADFYRRSGGLQAAYDWDRKGIKERLASIGAKMSNVFMHGFLWATAASWLEHPEGGPKPPDEFQRMTHYAIANSDSWHGVPTHALYTHSLVDDDPARPDLDHRPYEPGWAIEGA